MLLNKNDRLYGSRRKGRRGLQKIKPAIRRIENKTLNNIMEKYNRAVPCFCIKREKSDNPLNDTNYMIRHKKKTMHGQFMKKQKFVQNSFMLIKTPFYFKNLNL